MLLFQKCTTPELIIQTDLFVKAAGPETHTEKYKVHMNIYVSEEYFPGTEFTKHYSEKKKKSMLLFFKNTKEL